MKYTSKVTMAWARSKDWSLWFRETTTSTNDIARREAFQTKSDFKLYLANQQSHGRGRCINSWEDTEGNFLSSWSYKMSSPPQHIMAPLVGLALFKSCQEVWPNLKWSLKAPNDLFLVDKKVAGLLVETIQQGSEHRLIIGLGMNIDSHPQHIEMATHITSHLGTGASIEEPRWCQLLAELYIQFEEVLGKGAASYMAREDREALLVALNAWPLHNPFIEIDDQGSLITDTGVIPWSSL